MPPIKFLLGGDEAQPLQLAFAGDPPERKVSDFDTRKAGGVFFLGKTKRSAICFQARLVSVDNADDEAEAASAIDSGVVIQPEQFSISTIPA
jgi:hypothetical protein